MSLRKILVKYGNVLCALAVLVAPMAARTCRLLYYEPKEPEGLDEFVKRKL